MKQFKEMSEKEWAEAVDNVPKEELESLTERVNSLIDEGKAFDGLMLLVKELTSIMKKQDIEL